MTVSSYSHTDTSWQIWTLDQRTPPRDNDRFIGLHRAIGEAGILYEPDLVLASEWDRQGGRQAALQLLTRPDHPTAIFAASDLQAIGVLEAARSLNMSVPTDLSVIGFDGIELSEIMELSTIQQPMQYMGELGAQKLIAQIEESASAGSRPELIRLQTRLVQRRTITTPPHISKATPRQEAREGGIKVFNDFLWRQHGIIYQIYPRSFKDSKRTPMQWDSSPNAGFCPPGSEPWLPLPADYQQINVAVEREDPHSLLNLTRRLIELRRSTPALSTGCYHTVDSVPDNCFVYQRKSDSQYYLIALNFSGQEQIVKLPEMGYGRKLLSTHLNREESVNLAFLRLRSEEGCVLKVEKICND